MDVKNVVVIIGKNFTKDLIIEEIKKEGYKDNFYFANESLMHEFTQKVKVAQEIWIFGECKHLSSYDYVLGKGFDIWKMG